MENFIVSARKYRPVTFESVVGQQHITNTLKNAIKNNQLAQAFLFCGPRGVGKTTCARILAKTINCQNLSPNIEPCGVCESCLSFQNGNSFSIHELDAASNNSVDDIRSLIEQVRIPPQSGKYKIYIIDEIHMLSQAAFNAFLKTLEEPPSYAIFILATTEKHKILPTILSRCQIFDFNRIRVEDMASHLASIADKEDIAFDNDGLHLIAQKADGGLRDALSMFDQIASFSNRNITYKAVIDNLNILDYDYYFKLTDFLLKENVAQTLVIFDDILANGFDGNNFIIGLASHFRNLLVGKDPTTLKLLEVSEGIRQKYLQQSQATSASFLLSALNIANQCDLNYKQSKNQRLQVEMALIKMCHIASAINLVNLPVSNNDSERDLKKKPDTLISETESPKQNVENTTPKTSVTSNEGIENQPLKKENDGPASGDSEAADLPVEPKAVPVEKPKVTMPKPGLVTSSLIPNLNDLTVKSEVAESDEPQYISGDAKNAFSNDDFLKLWHEYASKSKAAAKLNLFTVMTSNPPVLLPDWKIEVIIENKIQQDLLILEKIDLLNFLRVELKNFSIDIVPKQAEQTTKRRLYTSNEKYQHMVEKNPALEEFRRHFNLGIE
ncbi:DNA polymerase III subunit gamma/tau [Pedobacter sp. HMF7647]|uniref:DNA polymerase III subunit gamma/tau n=1 Tax=Hufsiella arboris TaxID=2695275 RepID=A0A7K1YF52_9SPHI|nr:DNA polymerase III subunit gamma/tau [Hufsiella arboris]MXV53021.1 DNA polymerase III subunit gamma/tau [Hufsiella arboris]